MYLKMESSSSSNYSNRRNMWIVNSKGSEVAPKKTNYLRYLGKDEFEDFQSVDKVINLDSLTEQHSPPGCTFKKIHYSVVYYKLCFNEKSGIPIVFESITINKDLYVSLSYKGYHISLPEWFGNGHNCKLTNCSMLENFPV